MTAERPLDLLATVLADLGPGRTPTVSVTGTGTLHSAFRVSDLAISSIAAAGVALARLIALGAPPELIVDRGLAARWFDRTLVPEGWTLPPVWDAVAGDYRAADGWIRLHTNAPHHRAAALRVLDVAADRSAVAAAVARWPATDLETAVVEIGGAAAAMRSPEEWSAHPQGVAVAAEPVLASRPTLPAEPLSTADAQRPLAGIRVLDLTRVLAGPVATRLLAGWGATVLRIDPPRWDEPGVIPEVLLGKHTARLDLRTADGHARFTALLRSADVVVSGYRSDALGRLGLGADERSVLRPGLVDVALNAYGWTGPWASRRGFDSLVQMSTGIAEAGMRAFARDRPTPLPVQALDHATGYLTAAAVLRGLALRRETEHGSQWRLSLARTARMLVDAGPQPPDDAEPAAEQPVSETVEQTSWGPARRVLPPLAVAGSPLRWDVPARALGEDRAEWPRR